MGGWAINVMGNQAFPVPLQYELRCQNPSSAAQVTAVTVPQVPGLTLGNIQTDSRSQGQQKIFLVHLTGTVTGQERNYPLSITVQTNGWKRTLPFATVSTAPIPNPVNWVHIDQGLGGAGGPYMSSRIYEFAVTNPTDRPIRFVRLAQAGNFAIDNYHVIAGLNDQVDSIPANARSVPAGGTEILPQQTATIYCSVHFSANVRNVVFQPAMELQREDGTTGLELLSAAIWTETELPNAMPSSYVTIANDAAAVSSVT